MDPPVDSNRSSNASEWFVQQDGQVSGPLTEPDMRKRVMTSRDPSMQVRQGSGVWHPADLVRQKIKKLASEGVYIRFSGKVEGPFTIAKAWELLGTVSTDEVEVRTGSKGDWFAADRWLAAVRRLRKKNQRATDGVAAPNLQTVEPKTTLALPVDDAILEAELIEEEEILEATLVPQPVQSSFNHPLAATPPALPHRPSRSRSQVPNKTSEKIWVKVGLGALSMMVVLVGLGLRGYSRYQRSVNRNQADAAATDTDQRLTSRSSPSVVSSFPLGAGSMTTATAPVLEPNTLFRPRMITTVGHIEAGTAFAAKTKSKPQTLVITALHLFGPAGGLASDLPGAKLNVFWVGLSLNDCQTGREIGSVPIKPMLLRDTGPMPTVTSQGDVAVCQVRANSNTTLNPMTLSARTPQPGEPVWLVSEVLGQSGLTHRAVVEVIEDGWLIYRFDKSLELRATSGAPVVDRYGEVIAVNAGGGDQDGATFGAGTPVEKFLNALDQQLL